MFKNTNAGNLSYGMIGEKGRSIILTYSYTTGSGIYEGRRQMTYSSATSLSVDNAYTCATGSTAHTMDNSQCIPTTIYGFKKSIDLNAIVANVNTAASACMLSDNVTSVETTIAGPFTKLAELTSTTGTVTDTTYLDTTKYKEFYIEYILADAAVFPNHIPYGMVNNSLPYRVAYRSEYAVWHIKTTEIYLSIVNTDYSGSKIIVYGR